MRRPTSALAKAVLGTALAASTVSAQQSPPLATPGVDPAGVSASVPPINAARGARHLLRNGWDYITYQEYERALAFFREAETRKAELNDAERLKLKQGVDRAQRGLREAANGLSSERAYARSGAARRPGALAVATTTPTPTPVNGAEPRFEREPIQLTGGGAADVRAPAPAVATAPAPINAPAPVLTPAPIPPTPDVEAPTPAAVPNTTPAPAEAPAPLPAPAPIPEPGPLPELPPPPQDVPLPPPTPTPSREPSLSAAAASAAVAELPTTPTALPPPVAVAVAGPVPAAAPAPVPAPAPSPAPAPRPVPEASPEVESLPALPDGGGRGLAAELPAARPAPAQPAIVEPPPAPAAEEMPAPLPAAVPVPVPAPVPSSEPPIVSPPATSPEAPAAAAAAVPDTPPAPMGLPATPAAVIPVPDPPPPPPAPAPAQPEVPSRGRYGIDTLIPQRASDPPASTLSPELQREVERIAQKQEEELRRPQAPAVGNPADTPPTPGSPTSTRLEISRAPSPTEARPIRAIPVPEEFVPLPKREWNPNRKYWAAAATCHLPLYFQDASLERYGYSVEQYFGPVGRYMTFPVDDPRQSKQRNQLLQPIFSSGLFAAQIVLLPFNMLMDPPWEAEYDLGYYRPGDRVPSDVFYLPLFGVGPPLAGKNYGTPPSHAPSPSTSASRW